MKNLLIGVTVFLMFWLGPAHETFAWKGQHTQDKKERSEELGRLQQTQLVQRVVSGLLESEFFVSTDLPHRVALSTLRVEGDDVGLTGREFTNKVLNVLLQSLQILIVNHDLRLDESLEYKLMEYLPELETRKQGVMLGANHYLSGSIKTGHQMRESGLVERHYIAKLEVREIRSDKLVAQTSYDYQRGHMKRKR